MRNSRLFIMLALATLVGFSSCKKDDDEPKPELKANEVSITATDYGKWIYFSFDKKEIIGESAVKELKEGLDWDIAFNRYNIRLNGGKSGKGKAEAVSVQGQTGKTGWDAVTKAPESGYQADDMISVMVGHEMPPTFESIAGSSVITGGKNGSWVKMGGMPPSYTVTNQIFVVKTAKGNFAKIWLKQYVGADKKGGHVVMKYMYQADGSKDF